MLSSLGHKSQDDQHHIDDDHSHNESPPEYRILGTRIVHLFPNGSPSRDDGAIDAAIAARKAAKAAKDFAEADRIRDELAAQGVELIDKPGGVTEWIRA